MHLSVWRIKTANARAALFIAKYGKVSESVLKTLDSLTDLSIDIIRVFGLPYKATWDVNRLS
jgi:hypothetical protein